ncbi:RNB-domain-containing protein [Ramicandelaber brevisporus]|nr:RNB-domain-containing protein [Ramicandelaber brevisporus]
MLGQGEGEWQIPQDEYTNRRVMTGHRIFSIDPSTAKDLDDALSVRKLSVQEYYEIGVHIADVSYFVRPDTKLDTEAQSRATTIYLVDRAVPMLPHILSEQLCSLNPGTPRLAFSAVFTIRVTKPVSEEYPHDDVSILQTWLGRTIINSCCKMAYQNAQAVIEGGHLDAYPASSSAEGRPQLPPVSLYHGVSSADVENDILLLDRLAKSMRARRFATGSVSLDKVKFGFDLDTIKIPSGSSVQIQQDSNRLIEEFMLLANTAVAHHIAAFMPRSAFLRRHPFPLGRKMNEFLNSMASLAPHYQQLHPDCAPEDNPFASFSARSSLEIHQSLSKFTDERTRMAVIQMCVVPMQRARYFPGGAVPAEIRKHYALNEDLYTHFTSPIRRYPDVIVHRMATAMINVNESAVTSRLKLTADSLVELASHCNARKELARAAQDNSDRLFITVLLVRLYHYAEATVIDVMPRAIKVYVHGFGIERQLHYDQMQINNVELDAKGKWVRLHWSQDDNSSETAIKEIKMDEAALRKILHPSMFFNASDKGVNEGIDLENRTQSLRITSIVRVKVYPELKENGFAQMEVNMARPIQFD